MRTGGKPAVKRKTKIFFLITVFLIAVIFQTSAKDSYNYDLPDFQRIEVSGSMTVVLEKRSSPGMYIELEKSSIDDLSWYVSVKTLVIKKKSSFPDFSNIKIVLYYNNEISSVLSKNRAIVKNIRKLSSDRILIEAVSGGIVDLIIETERLEARSVRTSRMKLSGKCGSLYVQADSGSEVMSYELFSDKVQASAHSGGIIKVHALKSIDASSGLGSSIYFKGEPEKKYFTSGTGGDIVEVK